MPYLRDREQIARNFLVLLLHGTGTVSKSGEDFSWQSVGRADLRYLMSRNGFFGIASKD